MFTGLIRGRRQRGIRLCGLPGAEDKGAMSLRVFTAGNRGLGQRRWRLSDSR